MRLPPPLLALLLVARGAAFSPSTPSRAARPLRGGENDWVTQGLDARELVDLEDGLLAGEGDVLPAAGLSWPGCRVAIVAAASAARPDAEVVVRLGNSATGWGTGAHPSTRLCLEFLSEQLEPGDRVMDYGTGSGVLAIGALGLGAATVLGVDVEAEALVAAQANLELNGYDVGGGQAELAHVREIVPGGLAPPADICVANILIGQLVRPSMVAVLSSNVRPGGLLCLSGVRPDQCGSLREVYSRHFEWEPAMYAEAEPGAEGKAYWGRWSRLVGRRKASGFGADDIALLSDLAVS